MFELCLDLAKAFGLGMGLELGSKALGVWLELVEHAWKAGLNEMLTW